MTRISENSLANRLLADVARNRQQIAKFSEELSSGVKVQDPGDSVVSGTISQLNGVLERVDSFGQRISAVTNFVNYQNDAITQAGDLLTRAKEIAAQGANETNSADDRYALAQAVFQLRDHMVSLANSKFQGIYLFAGAADNNPPYNAAAYDFGVVGGLQRYVYTTAPGADQTRDVRVTENLTLTTNIPGNAVFDQAIQGLERLGRALSGYKTNPAVGAPDGTGDAYIFPDEYSMQTLDIQSAMDALEKARTQDIMPSLVNMAGRMKRLETADSLLDLSKNSSQEVLAGLRDADVIESATNLSIAETALQASMTVSAKVLRMSILDYL